ncbi:hypothetical protein ACEQ6C_40385, partial [Rhizobium ruizarguesonis]
KKGWRCTACMAEPPSVPRKPTFLFSCQRAHDKQEPNSFMSGDLALFSIVFACTYALSRDYQ